MKSLVVVALFLLQCSCTTLVTRRDLYSPEPGPDSLERYKELNPASTTTTTTTTRTQTEETGPPPQFR